MHQPSGTESLFQWLSTFPPDSQARLKKVNLAATTAAHVILALTYGVYDSHIRRLNQVIIKLQVRRLTAERQNDEVTFQQVQNKLHELHVAIDQVTGVEMRHQPACNRVMRRKPINSTNDVSYFRAG